jgi:hypothetical protein
MARAKPKHITKLSAMFRDPLLRAAFEASEDDGLAPPHWSRPIIPAPLTAAPRSA